MSLCASLGDLDSLLEKAGGFASKLWISRSELFLYRFTLHFFFCCDWYFQKSLQTLDHVLFAGHLQYVQVHIVLCPRLTLRSGLMFEKTGN